MYVEDFVTIPVVFDQFPEISGHYHYHAPPLCLLKSLGVPVPKKSAWWKSAGAAAWPEHGPEVQIGWALDGAPIMGPFKGRGGWRHVVRLRRSHLNDPES